jgi:hypothetical protein
MLSFIQSVAMGERKGPAKKSVIAKNFYEIKMNSLEIQWQSVTKYKSSLSLDEV